MKAYVILFFISIAVFACSKDNAEEEEYGPGSLIGIWKEYEAYMDPGDGSGTFQPVNGITLTINSDRTYTTSPNHYAWGGSGRIQLYNDSTVQFVRSASDPLFYATFRFKADKMEVYYMCIEGCGSKFKRAKAGN